MPAQQNYANHRRHRPAYVLVYFILFLNIVWTAYRAVRAPSTDAILAALTAVALGMLSYYARVFALTVQDRVIRLEMRLRLRELLPGPLQARIGDFSVAQLVAMRFASDAELPQLAERILRDGIKDPTTIKQAVGNWQGDDLRA